MYKFPYYRMSSWFVAEDDIRKIFGWIQHFRDLKIPHALAYGTGEDTTKYALWVIGEEVLIALPTNSEPIGEKIYAFKWPDEALWIQ